VLHPRHRNAFRFEIAGEDRVRGQRTTRLTFLETARPTLVREPNGDDLVSRGRVWADPQFGTVWRVEWHYAAPSRSGWTPYLQVDFVHHEALQMMVPDRMREIFHANARQRGEGRATYSNFRRFGTSARIVPQS
jgi:hypothetical protein